MKGCTWRVVSHSWDQRQVLRTNTSSWRVAQLQQEVMAVVTLPYRGEQMELRTSTDGLD